MPVQLGYVKLFCNFWSIHGEDTRQVLEPHEAERVQTNLGFPLSELISHMCRSRMAQNIRGFQNVAHNQNLAHKNTSLAVCV